MKHWHWRWLVIVLLLSSTFIMLEQCDDDKATNTRQPKIRNTEKITCTECMESLALVGVGPDDIVSCDRRLFTAFSAHRRIKEIKRRGNGLLTTGEADSRLSEFETSAE